MTKESTYKGKFGDWDRLNTMLTANAADLAHLEPLRAQLAASLAQGQAQAAQQAVHTAAKQDTSQQLRTTVIEGDRLASLLRKALQQHYGIRSEKLVEFGSRRSAAGCGPRRSRTPPRRPFPRPRPPRRHREPRPPGLIRRRRANPGPPNRVLEGSVSGRASARPFFVSARPGHPAQAAAILPTPQRSIAETLEESPGRRKDRRGKISIAGPLEESLRQNKHRSRKISIAGSR